MSFSYIGDELEFFKHASNWKRYYGRLIRPYLGSSVAEVGAGVGATTEFLCDGRHDSWYCLEPDHDMAAEISRKIAAGELPLICRSVASRLADLPPELKFDSIVYIDVLEHIENDIDELGGALERLNDGGRLVILSPAHQFLFTPFDKAIGHYRRYNKNSLAAVIPDELEVVKLVYLDALGAIASLGNKLLLHQSMPTLKQVVFWDRMLVPVSKFIDPILFHQVGKSILGVWERATVVRK